MAGLRGLGPERKSHEVAFALGTLLVALSAPQAMSDPDRNASYVLSEATTLMDFGLFKAEAVLDRSLDGFRRRTGLLVLTFAKYEPEANRIRLSVSLVDVAP